MSKFDLNSFIGTPDVMKNAVQNIDIDKLVPYKNHCFRLYEGERLDDMVRSVRNYGIMIPVIVRNVPNTDTFEILSGHNRVNAAKIAGKKNVPAVVKENLPDEFAEIYVVESNAMLSRYRDNIALVSMAKKQLKPSKLRTAVIRIIAVFIAGYGVYAFICRDVGIYMFLKSHFVFYDFSEPVICFLIDYLAVMGLFVFVGDLAGNLIRFAYGHDRKNIK